MTDINRTLAERGERYGVFRDHAVIAQGIKDAMWHTKGWVVLADDQKQALEVIADKIARILNGDPNYRDNWHDIIGYARLVEQRLIEDQTPVPPKEHETVSGQTITAADYDALLKGISVARAKETGKVLWSKSMPLDDLAYTLGIMRGDEI